MRELALHILDIVENAIDADAHHIDLSIVENLDPEYGGFGTRSMKKAIGG